MPVASNPVTGILATPVAVTESTALVAVTPVTPAEDDAATVTPFVEAVLSTPVTLTPIPAPSDTVTDPTPEDAATPVVGMLGASPLIAGDPISPVAETPVTPTVFVPLMDKVPTEPVASWPIGCTGRPPTSPVADKPAWETETLEDAVTAPTEPVTERPLSCTGSCPTAPVPATPVGEITASLKTVTEPTTPDTPRPVAGIVAAPTMETGPTPVVTPIPVTATPEASPDTVIVPTEPEAEGRVTAGLLQVPLLQLLRPQPVKTTLASAITCYPFGEFRLYG